MDQTAHQSFTELEVRKKAREFKLEVEKLTKCFPADEKYRLTDQIIRAVRSIHANITEGHGRFTYKDQLHFCIQARGSLSETYNHLIDALDSVYITSEQVARFKNKIDDVSRCLNGYISYLRKR